MSLNWMTSCLLLILLLFHGIVEITSCVFLSKIETEPNLTQVVTEALEAITLITYQDEVTTELVKADLLSSLNGRLPNALRTELLRLAMALHNRRLMVELMTQLLKDSQPHELATILAAIR